METYCDKIPRMKLNIQCQLTNTAVDLTDPDIEAVIYALLRWQTYSPESNCGNLPAWEPCPQNR